MKELSIVMAKTEIIGELPTVGEITHRNQANHL